jgi:hypothetical protein
MIVIFTIPFVASSLRSADDTIMLVAPAMTSGSADVHICRYVRASRIVVRAIRVSISRPSDFALSVSVTDRSSTASTCVEDS